MPREDQTCARCGSAGTSGSPCTATIRDHGVAGDLAKRRDLLAQTLTELSTEQRRALELAFFNGCSQHEIAQAMSAPVGNVKNYLRRGLLKLRQLASRHD